MKRDEKTLGRTISISYSQSELERDVTYRISQLEKKVGRLEEMLERIIRLMYTGSEERRCMTCKFCKNIDEKIHVVWICSHPDNEHYGSQAYLEVDPLKAACERYELKGE